jgi:hypothetical protein
LFLLALDCFGLLRQILAVDCAVRVSSPSKTTRQMHDTTSFLASHGFCRPFVFITLRIAFPASPLYSQIAGGCTLCVLRFRPQLFAVLRFTHSSPCVFSNLHALFRSWTLFLHTRPFVFNGLRALLQKHPGGGVSTRPRTERRSRSQRTWTHAESRTQWRRNIAQRIAAARATPFFTKCARGVGAQPVASRFALRIDALHGESGQKLHIVSLSATGAFLRRRSSGADPNSPG